MLDTVGFGGWEGGPVEGNGGEEDDVGVICAAKQIACTKEVTTHTQ